MARQICMYKYIFFTNILRILDERKMTKNELANKSGVSVSFLSDLTTGKANPSLKVMESLANALEISLPLLLESTDLDEVSLEILAAGKTYSSLPTGYIRISAILPEYQVFIVKKWQKKAMEEIKNYQHQKKENK